MFGSAARGGLHRSRLARLVGAIALTGACSSEGNFFNEPSGLAGRAGASAHGGKGGGAGASASGGTSGGQAGGVGGSAGTGQGGSSGAAAAAGGTGNAGRGATGGIDSAGTGGTSGGAATAGQGLAGGGGSGTAGKSGKAGDGSGGAGTSSAGSSTEGGASGLAGDAGTAGMGGEPCVPSDERCDGVSNDCNDQVDEGGVCPAGCSARTRDGHVYLLCLFNNPNNQLDYDAATARCATAGDDLGLGVTLELAQIDSAPESDFAKAWIVAEATQDGMVWLGANDIEQENRWVWGRGSSAVRFFNGSDQGGGTPYMGRFNDWASGRPNASNNVDEDCGAFDSDFAWQWNDLACGTPRLGFLCKQTP